MTAINTARDDGAAPAADRASIAERLDRLPLTALHLGILALCTLGVAVDIGEVALSNTFSAIFLAPPYSASRGEVSWLLAAVFAGGAIGAPVFGWLADRGGRRAALQAALIVVVLSSLAVAASPTIAWMTAFRFISGLALGGYPPLTVAYLSDVLPASRRGPLIMLSAALAFLGAPAMIFLIRWLTPLAPLGLEGWRWALIAGAAFAAITAALFRLVPQSPRWLAARGRFAEAEHVMGRFERTLPQVSRSMPAPRARVDTAPLPAEKNAPTLDRKPNHGGRMALFIALYALAPWATIGFPLLSAAVMMQKGFRIADSLLFAGLSMFGSAAGLAATAFCVDRIERRTALIVCAGALATLGLLFAITTGLTPLILLGAGFNMVSGLYAAVLVLYNAELFPTSVRASATATAWGAGRAVSVLVPIVLLPLLGAYGPLAMFAVVATALIASLLLVLIVGPRGLAGRPVE